MKTVVSLQDLADQEIHPGPLLKQFQTLTADALSGLMQGTLVEVPCPGCRSTAASPAFDKYGVSYRQCAQCGSVYASPRPAEAALAAYDASSVPAKFWREQVLGATGSTRAEKLSAPRAEWVTASIAEYVPSATALLDLSPADEAFVAEVKALAPRMTTIVSGSARDTSWRSKGPFDVVTAFDTIDRAADLPALVDAMAGVLRPGGLLFCAAPTISGFDLQVLWDRAGAIMPPAKLNLLSIDGFTRLFSRNTWSLVEVSTPGMFDVENVRRAVQADPDGPWPRVVRGLVEQGDEARCEFQEYLQRHRLASFARLVVRRV